MAEDFERARALFKKADSNGTTLYEHLTAVLLQIAKEQPENPLAVFEQISAKLKQAALQLPQLKEIPTVAQEPEAKKAFVAELNKTTRLVAGDKREDDDASSADEVSLPDLMQEADLLELGGVALGKEETYKLLLSIQKLSRELELDNVRFFGKFLGITNDYYIVEGKPASWPEDKDSDPDNKREPWGEGLNSLAYYAATSVYGPWTMLPAVWPEQVMVARQTRRYLTGTLTAPVLGFPRFAWGEAAYLRVQIARIAAATVVSPKGLFTLADDSDSAVAPNEEYTGTSAAELLNLDNWVHHRQHLLRQGRTTPWIAPEKDEDEEEDAKEEEEEPEEPAKLLSAISDDDSALKQVPAWTVRSSSEGGVSTQHSAVSVASILWPGAVAVAKNKQLVNVYVGWGQKYLGTPYTPPAPPAIQAEYVPRFNAEEGETDPLVEQEDPLPPSDLDHRSGDEDEEDLEDDEAGDADADEENEEDEEADD